MAKLPRYVSPKRLASGATAYFWTRPAWAKPPAERHGHTCPVVSTPLGTDLAAAIAAGERINEAFEGWRLGRRATLTPGTVAWLFKWYREQDRWATLGAKTRVDYRKMMEMVADWPMKVGTFGQRSAKAVDGVAADALYKLIRQRGERQGTYAMQVCRLVWNWAVRHRTVTGVSFNPFAKMGLNSTAAEGNRPTTRAEYDLYRATARDMGLQSMATAAALGFELCQRVWDVYGFEDPNGEKARGFLWADYRPGESIALRQSKTNKLHVVPLSAPGPDGQPIALYPALEEELARTPRLADEIIIEERTGTQFKARRVSKLHRAICDKAGLPKAMTPTGFRHGGATEIGDSGETDLRAITGHTELDTTAIYNKASAEKAIRIGLARLTYAAEQKAER